jgi:hypothetical protein
MSNPSTQVENLPVPGAPQTEVRKATAMEDQAAALARTAAAAEAMAGISVNPKRDLYVAMLHACIMGRVATDVTGFLRFADELCDGVAARYPDQGQQP